MTQRIEADTAVTMIGTWDASRGRTPLDGANGGLASVLERDGDVFVIHTGGGRQTCASMNSFHPTCLPRDGHRSKLPGRRARRPARDWRGGRLWQCQPPHSE